MLLKYMRNSDGAPADSWKEAGPQGRIGVLVRRWALWLCLSVATLLPAGTAQACDTPVYYYTIQMWQRDAYHVYCFYGDAEGSVAAPVNQYLQRVAQEAQGHANLVFTGVDVNRLSSVEYTDQDRQIWLRYQSRPLPLYVILTPRGRELFVGALDLAAAQALVDSPKRRRIADQLCQGKHGLLLLLLGPNETENVAAQKTTREVLGRVAVEGVQIGLVEVSRDDSQEQWLVQQLLHLEDDLPDLDNTMIFPVFGRGHVLEPYLGKGITTTNLLEPIAFMSGPCACEVKASSAGMDLLTNYDWQAHLANWPQPEEAPLNSLLFNIPATADAEASPSAPIPDADTDRQTELPQADERSVDAKPATSAPAREAEGHSSSKPDIEHEQKPTSQTQQRAGESTPPAAATPDVSPLPLAGAGDRNQSHQVEPDRASLPRQAADLQVEESSSLGVLLSERLSVALAIATLLVVVVGFAIIWRRRER